MKKKNNSLFFFTIFIFLFLFCTVSVIFTEKCVETDLDSDGKLNIATFTFKPVNEAYDINEFCLWASSYEANDIDITKTVKAVGNTVLQEDKTDAVTLKQTQPQDDNAQEKTTKQSGTANTNADLNNSKWYVYLIAGVLAVGAIAGIAFVAIKSSHNNEESENKDDSDGDKKEE